jgi:hypothetical protein
MTMCGCECTPKTITGVDYRHTLITAYVQIEGQTREAALWHAKKVWSALKYRLPKAVVKAPRRRTSNNGFLFEVPVIIEECVNEAKAVIAKMVLKGSI